MLYCINRAKQGRSMLRPYKPRASGGFRKDD